MFPVISNLHLGGSESHSISCFLVVPIPNIDHVYLILTGHIGNIQFIIQFHPVGNLVRGLPSRRVSRIIQRASKLYRELVPGDIWMTYNMVTKSNLKGLVSPF